MLVAKAVCAAMRVANLFSPLIKQIGARLNKRKKIEKENYPREFASQVHRFKM
jgi:hypothetical protein